MQTYGLDLDIAAAEYVARLLLLASMREWYFAAIRETTRDVAHEDEILGLGTVIDDLRATS